MIAAAAAVAALALSAAACATEPTGTCGTRDLTRPPRTEPEVRPILARSCALGGCHLRAPGAGGLVLDTTSPAWVDALVGVPSRQGVGLDLIAAGSPAESWLVHRIDGCGGRMPPAGDPLTPDERAAIVGWIAAGATRGP
jgi:hypothetical protein